MREVINGTEYDTEKETILFGYREMMVVKWYYKASDGNYLMHTIVGLTERIFLIAEEKVKEEARLTLSTDQYMNLFGIP